jgi:hypothetical protein
MKEQYRVRHGGLMRCCLASLDDAMVAATEPPKEGDKAECRYCKDSYGMRFRDGAWEWAKPLDVA